MKLPDIKRKSAKVRVLYLSLIAYMARIDDKLDEEELSLLNKMTVGFGIDEKYHAEIFSEKTYSKKQIEEIFLILKEKNLQYSFILDLITMAMADGVLMDSEKMMLSHIVKLVGIKNDEFHNLIYFAQAASGLDPENPIDPMFSYVIDMFFDWARKGDVKLYKQTTFAINDKVDAILKESL